MSVTQESTWSIKLRRNRCECDNGETVQMRFSDDNEIYMKQEKNSMRFGARQKERCNPEGAGGFWSGVEGAIG